MNTFPQNPGPYGHGGSTGVWIDPKALNPATVFDATGAPLPGNRLPVDNDGRILPFQAAPAVLYIKTASRKIVALYPSVPTVGTAPTVTGSKGANAALTSLMTTLAALGIVVDGTT